MESARTVTRPFLSHVRSVSMSSRIACRSRKSSLPGRLRSHQSRTSHPVAISPPSTIMLTDQRRFGSLLHSRTWQTHSPPSPRQPWPHPPRHQSSTSIRLRSGLRSHPSVHRRIPFSLSRGGHHLLRHVHRQRRAARILHRADLRLQPTEWSSALLPSRARMMFGLTRTG